MFNLVLIVVLIAHTFFGHTWALEPCKTAVKDCVTFSAVRVPGKLLDFLVLNLLSAIGTAISRKE